MMHDGVALRVVRAGRDRDLVPEVAREVDHLDARVRGVQLAHDLRRAVAAAVVDQHQLPVQPAPSSTSLSRRYSSCRIASSLKTGATTDSVRAMGGCGHVLLDRTNDAMRCGRSLMLHWRSSDRRSVRYSTFATRNSLPSRTSRPAPISRVVLEEEQRFLAPGPVAQRALGLHADQRLDVERGTQASFSIVTAQGTASARKIARLARALDDDDLVRAGVTGRGQRAHLARDSGCRRCSTCSTASWLPLHRLPSGRKFSGKIGVARALVRVGRVGQLQPLRQVGRVRKGGHDLSHPRPANFVLPPQ